MFLREFLKTANKARNFMQQKDNNLILGFIDASGSFDLNDRFFGVGCLLVKNPGAMTDKLHLIFQRVMAISKSYRDQAIDALVKAGKHDEVIKMLKKSKNFELKYDRISPVKFSHYKEMLKIFLEDCQCRFSCMVIDRRNPNYNDDFFSTTWQAYTSYIAALITPELLNMPEAKVFLVLDEIAKPKKARYCLEETVLYKIAKRIDSKYQGKDLGKLIGALWVESHSNLLMQLCDVLLGLVMYDFKKKNNLASQKLQNRKEEVALELRKALNRDSLADTFTVHKPVYFHIWEAEWKQ